MNSVSTSTNSALLHNNVSSHHSTRVVLSSASKSPIFRHLKQRLIEDENAAWATGSMAVVLALLLLCFCRSQLWKKHVVSTPLSLHDSVEHLSHQKLKDVLRSKRKWDRYLSLRSQNLLSYEPRRSLLQSVEPHLHFGQETSKNFACYEGPLIHFGGSDDEIAWEGL